MRSKANSASVVSVGEECSVILNVYVFGGHLRKQTDSHVNLESKVFLLMTFYKVAADNNTCSLNCLI